MMTVTLTYDKLVAAVVCVVMLVFTGLYYPIDSPVAGVAVASLLCIPGLALIWFCDDLAETPCFPRGIARTSPPALIAARGWLFLVGYPVLLFCAAA